MFASRPRSSVFYRSLKFTDTKPAMPMLRVPSRNSSECGKGFLIVANFDRIGNKLGLAGILGVVLAGGMLVNQMISEQEIVAANKLADAQQFIDEHTLEANVALRRMQLAVRDIRLAKTPADVEKAAGALAEMNARTLKELDSAAQRTVKPENRERLEKIAALTKDYEKQASGQARTMLQIFEITAKRNAASADWSKAFDALRGSSALAIGANRFEIEKAMYEADTHFNAIRAASLAVRVHRRGNPAEGDRTALGRSGRCSGATAQRLQRPQYPGRDRAVCDLGQVV